MSGLRSLIQQARSVDKEVRAAERILEQARAARTALDEQIRQKNEDLEPTKVKVSRTRLPIHVVWVSRETIHLRVTRTGAKFSGTKNCYVPLSALDSPEPIIQVHTHWSYTGPYSGGRKYGSETKTFNIKRVDLKAAVDAFLDQPAAQ